MTRRFVKRTGFVGMGSIEFKWHAGRRGYLVIKPTVGRTDWQEEIATLCGENIPYRAYRHELGLPPLPRESPRPSRLARHRQAALAADTPRTVERVVDALWPRNDPLPMLSAAADAGLRRVEAALSRLMPRPGRPDPGASSAPRKSSL